MQEIEREITILIVSAPKPLPAYDELHRLFSYDPETGALVRKAPRGRKHKVGDPAGSIHSPKGYLRVGIGDSYHYAHCIIWKMMTGADPAALIDHEDGDNLNNRWKNLRPATNGQNICNSRLRRDNTSGVKGACWEADRRRWLAYVTVDGRNMKVGRFKSLAEAEAAIVAARIRFHGRFSRVA